MNKCYTKQTAGTSYIYVMKTQNDPHGQVASTTVDTLLETELCHVMTTILCTCAQKLTTHHSHASECNTR